MGERIHLAPRVILQYKEDQANVVPSPPIQSNAPPFELTPAHPLPKAQVIIEMDKQIIGKRELDKKDISIGRLPTNDVVIPSQHISRYLHAQILCNNGVWLIKSDEKKQNRLLYQGQNTHHHIFANGDRIYLAPGVVLQFELLP